MHRLATIALLAVLAVAACSGSTATQKPGGGGGATPPPNGGATPTSSSGGDCGYWCGSGSTKVTIGTAETTISSGGCYDGGEEGVDFRFGDFNKQTNDYVIGLVYHGGGSTPIVSGRTNGVVWVLSGDATGTIDGSGNGSFTGSDLLSDSTISGTFTCK